jgi:ribosomal protein S18 acetylase RimI-like enzyme
MSNTKDDVEDDHGDTLSIRLADTHDVEAMADLLGEFFDSHAVQLPSVFASAPPADRISYVREMLRQDNHRFFVATMQDRVVGMLSLEEVRRERTIGRAPEDHVMIHLVAVNASERRRGIATRLMRFAQRWVKTRGFTTIRIHVWEFNEAAQKLYESVGYTTLSRVLSREP